MNGRKLSAKSVVKLNIKYLKAKNEEAGETIQGDQIYQRADPQEITILEDIGEKVINVAENIDIGENKPVINEIIYSNAALKNVNIQDNMVLNCMLEIDCLYKVDDDNSRVENLHVNIPIEKNLEMENVNNSDVAVNAFVKSVSLKPDEDIDGLLLK